MFFELTDRLFNLTYFKEKKLSLLKDSLYRKMLIFPYCLSVSFHMLKDIYGISS